ncbi:MAG: ligase-associated DNA damage response DEXH box helicase [Myxococcota bacterium]
MTVPPTESTAHASTLERLRGWMDEQGWTPLPYQERAWEAYGRGDDGLLHVPTGAGKTYAAYLAALAEIADNPGDGLRILYVAPLRAMSRDIQKALQAPVDALDLPVTIESRTGDTSSSVKKRQKKRLPNVLITTPESLTLLMTYRHARRHFQTCRMIVVDEWHELLSSKRGTQTELALARMRNWCEEVQTWALTATISNVEEAAEAAAGVGSEPTIIKAELQRPITVETLLPREVDSFPWYGHMGLRMLDDALERLAPEHSTLVFTNTRSQAERWFQAVVDARPEWEPLMALHHGSISKKERRRIEDGLKSGDLRLVVCTSSLDLGVDFAPVERVFQLGSVKGVARLIQRAGRAGHRPGAPCQITCVPTHALELFEITAAREAVESGDLEPRHPMNKPLDVLAQHLVSCALGDGFVADDLYDELLTTGAYRTLTRDEFAWTMDLVEHGGDTLRAYDRYHKIVERDGRFVVEDRRIARQHRMSIGTITSDASVQVRYLNNKWLGTVEESFISKLEPGDVFMFAGRVLELESFHDMKAYVRVSHQEPSHLPRWMGGRLPISRSLSSAVRQLFEDVRDDNWDSAEVTAALPIVEAQTRLSAIPSHDQTLFELCETSEGYHAFIYPFEGQLVHEGLASLLALRLQRRQPGTFSLSANDYGIELLSAEPYPFVDLLMQDVFTDENLFDDAMESINVSELARRQFRGIARIAGLVFDGYPGSRKSDRQLQASSGLIYDVFAKYDPDNLLLHQSRREVLEQQFEETRLIETLRRLRETDWVITQVERPSPLGFPLLIDRIRARMSNQSLLQRIAKMKERWAD